MRARRLLCTQIYRTRVEEHDDTQKTSNTRTLSLPPHWVSVVCSSAHTHTRGRARAQARKHTNNQADTGILTHLLKSAPNDLHVMLLFARLARADQFHSLGHSPQWLCELIWLWTSVPWRVACELVTLIGSHTKRGQNSQPTPTSLGQGWMHVKV